MRLVFCFWTEIDSLDGPTRLQSLIMTQQPTARVSLFTSHKGHHLMISSRIFTEAEIQYMNMVLHPLE